jgi:hypothetical protein
MKANSGKVQRGLVARVWALISKTAVLIFMGRSPNRSALHFKLRDLPCA